MNNENFNRFVNQFEALSSAISLLKGGVPFVFKKRYVKDILICSEFLSHDSVLHNAIDEIEENLYSLREDKHRELYVKDILRKFVNYSRLFDPETITEQKEGDFLIGVPIVPGAKCTRSIVNRYCSGEIRTKEMSKAEKYIIHCFTALSDFASLLDAKCLSFEIDLMTIQKDVDIYIQRRRRWDVLSYYGYSQKSVQQKMESKESDEKHIDPIENTGNKTIVDSDDDSNKKEFDFKPLLSLLKRPYNDEQKMKFEECFNDLLDNDIFIKSKDQRFVAFAAIFFNTGYFKKPWSVYLKTFSCSFNRALESDWKRLNNQVVLEEKSLKDNPLLPCLREIPKRNKPIS